MRTILLLALTTVALGGCLTRPEPVALCDVTIKFGSYGMGADHVVAERVSLVARKDHGVRSVTRRPWGREGELDLCVTALSPAFAPGVFERLRPLIPAKGKVGPISILGPNGAHIEIAGPQPGT
ncbi:MAG: hypothetical protein JWP92_2479, partial [Caulobacter sp.]|nr:hypothetical protein [Caulobacter sp.]